MANPSTLPLCFYVMPFRLDEDVDVATFDPDDKEMQVCDFFLLSVY